MDMDVLRAGVARANKLLNQFSNRTRIIWREGSARHFSVGEWDSGGKCDRTVSYTAAEITHLIIPAIARDEVFTPMDAITASVVIQDEATLAGYQFVDILPYSVPRFVGVVNRLRQAKDIADCTHYCVPGASDVWNTVLIYFAGGTSVVFFCSIVHFIPNIR